MIKLFYIIPFLFLNLTISFSTGKLDFSTILIIIEEQENNNFVTETTPFSDGIFNALWDKECIFFDMKIDKPIKIILNGLDIKQYISTARDSGADSILLIKFHYSFLQQPGKKYELNTENLSYNLYSLNSMKSFGEGTINTTIKKIMDNSEDKNKYLTKTGFELLNEIFSKIE